MNNSNIFKEIKEYLSPQQVAEYYLQDKGKRAGNNVFYKSEMTIVKSFPVRLIPIGS